MIVGRIAVVLLAGCCFSQTAMAQDTLLQSVPNAAPNQWFTGSLEAPSPALPKAGMLALEPYLVYQVDTGMYGDDGHRRSIAHDSRTLESLVVIKYAITNRLTVEALPSLLRTWKAGNSSDGFGVGDLPIELEYRVRDGNYRNGAPSLTFDLGVTLPTGKYNRLSTSLNGVGQGAYLLKQGVVLQSLFDTWGNHPVRIRVYGAMYEPISHVSVDDLSVYGTGQGFHGNVRPGVSGQVGLGAGWALDQRWVFAFDVVQNYASRYRLDGIDGFGLAVATRGPSIASTALAPAVEYNWSAKAGIIAGIEFTAAGRNTPSHFAPQIAVAVSF